MSTGMNDNVTRVDFRARKPFTDRDEAGWPVLIAKPLRRTHADDAPAHELSHDDHLETAA